MGHEYVWGRYDILCLPPSFPFGGDAQASHSPHASATRVSHT